MRIGISGLFLRPAQVGGAEYMFRNLLAGFPEAASVDDELVLFANPGWDADIDPRITRRYVPTHWISNRFVLESTIVPFKARNFDAMLYPNYYTPPFNGSANTVSVIHDLQYRHFPQNFSRAKRLWLRWAHYQTLKFADRVIAISEFTRRDIIQHHGSKVADKVEVIRNPISWERFSHGVAEHERELIPDGPFVLTVAAHYQHKNLTTLIRAFPEVLRTYPETRLVLAGQLPDRLVGVSRMPDLRRLIRDLELERSVLVTGHITDNAMGELYRRARLFVFPSLFEGFGMPAIEALGMGLPVLTTKCGSIPEVTAGQAVYLEDPMSQRAMASMMLEMIREPDAYAPTSDVVAELRSYYSPVNVARAYYKVLTGVSPYRSGVVETPAPDRI